MDVSRRTALLRREALAVLGGALVASSRPAFAQTPLEVVRLGAMPIDACGVGFYGPETGIFQSNGIDAQVTRVNNGVAGISAVLGGDLDVAAGGPTQIAVAISKGLPLQMIAPASLYSKKDGNPNLVVAKNSPITSAKGLETATIGVSSLGDFNQISVLGWLDANKVPHDKVKFVEINFGEVGQALQRGIIQAAIIAEPAKTNAMRAGLFSELADTYIAIAPEQATVIWFTTKSWLQKKPDTAKRLVKAIYATGDWANKHPNLSGAIFAKIASMDPAVVATMVRRIYATKNDPRYIEPVLKLSAEYGLLPRPMAFSEFCASL
jgi:NitT/TauT family transport system substrate-binding protein